MAEVEGMSFNAVGQKCQTSGRVKESGWTRGPYLAASSWSRSWSAAATGTTCTAERQTRGSFGATLQLNDKMYRPTPSSR